MILAALLVVGCQNSTKTAHVGAAGSSDSSLRKRSLPSGAKEALPVNDVAGKLVPFSNFDLGEAGGEAELPYESASENPVVDSHTPEKTFKKDGSGSISYAENSNELLRATIAFPPPEAIKGIKSFKLHLKGMVLFIPKGNEKPLLGQTICLMDGAACLGEKPIEAQDLAPQSKFWAKAKVSGLDPFSYPTDFLAPIELEKDGNRLSQRSEDLEIDLLQQFKLDSKAATDFVMAHSVPYSKEGKFRKIRLSLGNRIYVSGGWIELEFDVDAEKVPQDWDKVPPLAVNGAKDNVRTWGKAEKEGTSKKSDLKFEMEPSEWTARDESGLSDLGKERARNLAATLSSRAREIQEVVILDSSEDCKFGEALKRELISNEWDANRVRVKAVSDSTRAVVLSVELLTPINSEEASAESESSDGIASEIDAALRSGL